MHDLANQPRRARAAILAADAEPAAQVEPSWNRRAGVYRAPLRSNSELLLWITCGTVLTLAYLSLLNPYWSASSDSDFYLALARNLAQGEGFVHNGNPVGLTPPGWPVLLAGAMHITPKLGWLKLINSGALLVFLAVGWWVLRRFFGPVITATATLLVGFSHIVIEMNWLFLSDPSFAALAMVAVWAALRASESPRAPGFWGWTVACALCAALATTVRWPGILLLPVIAAALFDGLEVWRPGHAARWIALGLVSVLVMGTFFSLRQVMPAEASRIDPRFPSTMVGNYELVNSARVEGPLDYVKRVGNAGYYVSGMLWSPASRTKLGWKPFGWLGNALVVCCVAAAAFAARRRRWLLLGAMAFCLPIVITWPSIVPRYLLAVMPIIVAGALAGLWLVLRALAEAAIKVHNDTDGGDGTLGAAERRRAMARGFSLAAISAVVLATLAIEAVGYTMEYHVARSGRQFARVHYAGIHRRLPSIARELVALDVQPGEVAVSEYHRNRLWTNRTHAWMRALYALTDRPVRTVPIALSRALEDSPETLAWLRKEGVRFYIYLPPTDRTLHFRGGRLEEFVFEGRKILRISEQQLQETDWRLYVIDDAAEGGFYYLYLPPSGPPKRVP